MRLSCNGCRVLRKGCSEDCSLRPCLVWLTSPESQANATLFLAKFYGRAGLINLINAAPSHLRSEIFRSLLYEACGRIINPVYGSVGLITSGDWTLCSSAVESVLRGGHLNITNHVSGDLQSPVSSLQDCDIRHVNKGSAAASPDRVRTRSGRKRSASRADSVMPPPEFLIESEAKFTITGWEDKKVFSIDQKSPSHDSLSVETVEPSLMRFEEGPIPRAEQVAEPRLSELGLELTLGFNPMLLQSYLSTVIEISDSEE